MGHDWFDEVGPVKTRSAPAQEHWQIIGGGLMKWIFCLACVLCLIYALSPSGTHCGENARVAQCRNNLKQIGLALQMYHEQYGTLPPAYVSDPSGRPLYSWRVLILPFLDRWDLSKLDVSKEFDLHEPWNGPKNIKLLDKMPSCFVCPSRRYPGWSNRTSYVAIAGPGTMFPGTASVKFADVTDGPSDILMVVEVENLNVPWTAPEDLDSRIISLKINDDRFPGISSKHPGVANVVFGDASVRELPEGITEKTLRALITIAGGEGNPYDAGSQAY